MFFGVDGCPDGWIAVWYDEQTYAGSALYGDIASLWDDFGAGVETVLTDVPIGLRTDSNDKRPCDAAARPALSPNRHASVFPVPIRAAVHADSYQAAKERQEARTDGSLGVQSWHIADNVAELDTFLREAEPGAVGTVRESHPEVCFWALNDESAAAYSKTGQPAAAFWERIDVLEAVDEEIVSHVRAAADSLDADVGNDDLVDAFVLALTASPNTGDLRTLPADPPTDEAGLPMEMVYSFRG